MCPRKINGERERERVDLRVGLPFQYATFREREGGRERGERGGERGERARSAAADA